MAMDWFYTVFVDPKTEGVVGVALCAAPDPFQAVERAKALHNSHTSVDDIMILVNTFAAELAKGGRFDGLPRERFVSASEWAYHLPAEVDNFQAAYAQVRAEVAMTGNAPSTTTKQ